MNVAVTLEFKADRKEPLGDLIRRVAAAFDQVGLEPQISATFSDGPPGLRSTSAVERAIKKYPHLARFERNDAPLHGVRFPPIRRLTDSDAEHSFPIADVLALADGLPRSLPFQSVNVLVGHADFGKAQDFPIGLTPPTGISIGDNWWINGRNRALSAFYAVDADAAARKLPEPPATIGAILSSLGKPKRSAQFVAPRLAAPGPATPSDSATPALPLDIAAISPIVAKYRAGMMALVERIGLPHDLPAPNDVRQTHRGASGPLKPTLVDAFKPRGYSCRGGSGMFTLRRRTAANHVVDVELDVGTWSRTLTAMFSVHGPGFNATLTMPVTLRGGGQYPIGDTANWERIVANLTTIVDELERTFSSPRSKAPSALRRRGSSLAGETMMLRSLAPILVFLAFVQPPREATSLLGAPLVAPPQAEDVRVRLETDLAAARSALARAPDDADARIWVGRRLAYLGRYREAIAEFNEGTTRFPADAHFLLSRLD